MAKEIDPKKVLNDILNNLSGLRLHFWNTTPDKKPSYLVMRLMGIVIDLLRETFVEFCQGEEDKGR